MTIGLQVSQAMNAGTASEVKASEAMGKKDHAGKRFACFCCCAPPTRSHPSGAAEHWRLAQQHFNGARSQMAEGEDSESAAVASPCNPFNGQP